VTDGRRGSRISNQKLGALTEADLLEIARYLVKAGYTVRRGRERRGNRETGPYDYYVEYE
jgi:hypothetical protein